VEVIAQLTEEIAAQLRGDAPASLESRMIEAKAREFGSQLVPLHPGIADPKLATYFRLDGSSEETASTLVESLRQLEDVEAAYVKPHAAPP